MLRLGISLLDLLLVAFLAFHCFPVISPAFLAFPASCPLVMYCFHALMLSLSMAFVAVAFY